VALCFWGLGDGRLQTVGGLSEVRDGRSAKGRGPPVARRHTHTRPCPPPPRSGWLSRLTKPVPDVEDFQQLDASLRGALAGALAVAGLDGAPPPGAAELMQPAVFSKQQEPLAGALEKVGARGGRRLG
jgi:hypothetical protein